MLGCISDMNTKNIAEVGNTTSAMKTNGLVNLEDSNKRNAHNSNCIAGYSTICISPNTMCISPCSYCMLSQYCKVD